MREARSRPHPYDDARKLASLDNMLRKGGPIKFENDVYDRLETKLQGVVGK